MSSTAPQPKTVLPFSPPVEQTLDQVLRKLATLDPQVLSELTNQTENQVQVLWKAARGLERHAWVIRCFCASTVWQQVTAVKRGRGNKDIAQKGLLAAVSKRSKKLGVTPSHVYRMAQIFRLLLDVKQNVKVDRDILDVLDEQGYWDHALNAADPVKAILTFADKKTTEKRFRVTDAERLITSPELSRKSIALKAVEAVREEAGQLSAREALIAHIKASQDIVKNLIIPDCPDASFCERVWNELLTELTEEHQELFDEDACKALRVAWKKGNHREDQLAKVTNFPIADVSRLMDSMADMSEFIRIQVRDRNKRSPFQLWHKVGQPFDNARYMPMARG